MPFLEFRQLELLVQPDAGAAEQRLSAQRQVHPATPSRVAHATGTNAGAAGAVSVEHPDVRPETAEFSVFARADGAADADDQH